MDIHTKEVICNDRK